MTDTGDEMVGAIYALAFPNLHAVVVANENFEEALDPERRAHLDRVRGAVLREAMRLVQHDWRWRGVLKADDPDAAVAALMGGSREVVRAHRAVAEADDPESDG